MAKDDYDVITFKVLIYLYAVLKRKIPFKERTIEKLIEKQEISDEYFTDVLRMMQEDELIRGLVFTATWGSNYIIANDLIDMHITTTGIRYLKENSMMKRVLDITMKTTGALADLAALVGLNAS